MGGRDMRRFAIGCAPFLAILVVLLLASEPDRAGESFDACAAAFPSDEVERAPKRTNPTVATMAAHCELGASSAPYGVFVSPRQDARPFYPWCGQGARILARRGAALCAQDRVTTSWQSQCNGRRPNYRYRAQRDDQRGA